MARYSEASIQYLVSEMLRYISWQGGGVEWLFYQFCEVYVNQGEV